MTFSCKNFDFNTEDCLKLKSDCIPGRPGCVLVGKVSFSEEIEKNKRAGRKIKKEKKETSQASGLEQ